MSQVRQGPRGKEGRSGDQTDAVCRKEQDERALPAGPGWGSYPVSTFLAGRGRGTGADSPQGQPLSSPFSLELLGRVARLTPPLCDLPRRPASPLTLPPSQPGRWWETLSAFSASLSAPDKARLGQGPIAGPRRVGSWAHAKKMLQLRDARGGFPICELSSASGFV